MLKIERRQKKSIKFDSTSGVSCWRKNEANFNCPFTFHHPHTFSPSVSGAPNNFLPKDSQTNPDDSQQAPTGVKKLHCVV